MSAGPPIPWRRAPSVITGQGPEGRFSDLYPEWTHTLHPSFTDSAYYAPAHRPALMPDDVRFNPTREALRFGIHPDAAPSNPAQGRSMMTPIESHYSSAAERTAEMDGIEEEHQSMLLSDFTTSELTRTGAYVPDAGLGTSGFTSRALQQDVLSPLLDRNKWQDAPRGRTTPNVPRLSYGLEPSVDFNVRRDERVWQAIRPALAVASRVLKVHPFWAAITNPYCLRPVPRSADSRTDAQFLADGSIPRVSIWPSQGIDGSIDQMFPAARAMFESSDPPVQMQPIIERFMGEILTFRLTGRYPPTAGQDEKNTTSGRTDSRLNRDATKPPIIVITLSVDTVWPLLHPGYSASEKAIWTLRLASTVLHELAHAAKFAVSFATAYTHLLKESPPVGPTTALDLAFQQHFRALGQQIGADTVVNGIVTKNRLMPDCWFYEDEQQAEEGKIFEKMIFGGALEGLGRGGGPGGSRNKFLNPGPVSISSFPWALKNPRTSEWNGEWSCGNYTLYLADPPPPFFSTCIPLQAEKASRLFDLRYWQSDVVKYGHQSLKLEPDDTTLMSMFFKLSKDRAQYDLAFPSRNVWTELIRELGALNKAPGTGILARHLLDKINEAMKQPMFEQYMNYWQAEWPRTDDRIENACAAAEQSFQAFYVAAQNVTAPAAIARENQGWRRDTGPRITTAGAQAFGDMRELLRLIAYEVQIHQHFLFEFNSNTEAARQTLHGQYSGPVAQRLQGRFRDDVLARAAALCDGLARDVGLAASMTAPRPANQSDYYRWLDGLNVGLGSMTTLIRSLRSLLDGIVEGVVLLRPAEAGAQEASGLERDIMKAMPKFQRRPKYQRRRYLAAKEAAALYPGSKGRRSLNRFMKLFP